MKNLLRKIFDNLFFYIFKMFFVSILIVTININFWNLKSLFINNEKEGIVVKVEQTFFGAQEVSEQMRFIYYISVKNQIFKSFKKKNDICLGSKVKFRNTNKKNVIYEVNGNKYANFYDVWDVLSPILMVLILIIIFYKIKQ